MLKQALKLLCLFFSNMLNQNKLCVCRFVPSCTNYAVQAIDYHGPFKGPILIFRRLTKCHPWGPVGYDPVPLQKTLQ